MGLGCPFQILSSCLTAFKSSFLFKSGITAQATSAAVFTFLQISGFASSAYTQQLRNGPNQNASVYKCDDQEHLTCACALDDASGPKLVERAPLGTKKYNLYYPDVFSVNQRLFSWNTSFDVESEGIKIGKVSKHIVSLNPKFSFESHQGELFSTAEEQFFAWGTLADVYDGTENKIGWIEEQIPTWLSPSRYHVFDYEKRLVGIAKMNFWGNKFIIKNPNDFYKTVGLISRPWQSFFRHKWTIEIFDKETVDRYHIDPRLLMMIAVYQTDNENLENKEFSFVDPSSCQLSCPQEDKYPDLFSRLRELSASVMHYDPMFIETLQTYSSEEEIEADEDLANIEIENEIEHLDYNTSNTLTFSEFQMLREKSNLIQNIKTLEKGLEILNDSSIESDRKAAVHRLLNEYIRQKPF